MAYPISMKLNSTPGPLPLIADDYVTTVEGLDPPSAVLLSRREYIQDGSTYVGGYLNNRNIVLTINIFRNVNYWRNRMYQWLRVGDYANIEVSFPDDPVGPGERPREILGIIESVEISHFADAKDAKQTIQVSIVCHDPFIYKEKTYIDNERITYQAGVTDITRTLDYPDAADGFFAIKITSSASLTRTPIKVSVMNEWDNKRQELNLKTLTYYSADPLWICCGYAHNLSGAKDYGLYRQQPGAPGNPENLARLIKLDSVFPVLKEGENELKISYAIDAGACYLSVFVRENYLGV